MKVKLKYSKYWFIYFLIKLFYMFFAVFIYAKLTILGDTSRWMSGNLSHSLEQILTNSSMMMDFLGGISSAIFGSVLGHLPFMLLALYGVFYSVSRIQLSNKQLFYILVLLSLPSFGVWSSIAGKEAIGVFYMGIMCGYLIDILNKTRSKPKPIEFLAFYLLLLFKPQYSIAIGSIFLFIFISRKLHLKGYGKLFLFIFHVSLAGVLFYVFRDIINELSFMLPAHFSLDAGSTRENTIWINDYDVIYNAPYGMFIGFWGPTVSEIFEKPIQSFVFVENLIIFAFCIFFIWKFFCKTLKTSKLDIFAFSLVFIVLFWLLFVHYPFGVLNPGSAVRYRENFYGFIVVFLFYLYISYFSSWKNEIKKSEYV
ncbi:MULTISPECIES: hypothetical protein [Aliarcobacter]|uniref:hypothetical protein n=1 Tax=Aliarcobacter TaxID=2321111 RepID=UPI0012604E53|nr:MULTISPECIES: hypothetical protein [Aliarcobacter]MCT7511881.1 hypothetical protein [Aliarcobacter cryaerophilus]